jgi:hypothetical protein
MIKRVAERDAPSGFAPAASGRLAVGVMLLALAACWPFHHGPTPQEQYYSAVSRGDAITAAQIWTQMSPKERTKLLRGEGVSREFMQQMLREQMLRQQVINYGSGPQGGLAGPQGTAPYQNPAAIQGR